MWYEINMAVGHVSENALLLFAPFPYCCSKKQDLLSEAVIPILSELISTTHFFFDCAEFVQIIYK